MSSQVYLYKYSDPGDTPLSQKEVREYIAYCHAQGITDIRIGQDLNLSPQRVSELTRNEKQLSDRTLMSITRSLAFLHPEGIPLMEIEERGPSGGAEEAFGPTSGERGVTPETISKEDYEGVLEALAAAQGVIAELRAKVEVETRRAGDYMKSTQQLLQYRDRSQRVLASLFVLAVEATEQVADRAGYERPTLTLNGQPATFADIARAMGL